jgi:coproporphyrinogen III oxidase-like Fe-S oxidoreductase
MRRGHGEQKREGSAVKNAESLPELKPWREIGWIFRDGDCIAIERQGDETRARVLAD